MNCLKLVCGASKTPGWLMHGEIWFARSMFRESLSMSDSGEEKVHHQAKFLVAVIFLICTMKDDPSRMKVDSRPVYPAFPHKRTYERDLVVAFGI